MTKHAFALLAASLTLLAPVASAEYPDYGYTLEPDPAAWLLINETVGVCVKTDTTTTPPNATVRPSC